jgi:hypothetical protein
VADDLRQTELHWLTIADAARLIERRQLSPVELTDALLARIEELDPQLNAFLLLTPEKAREQAKAAEREIMAGDYRGPLHGMPFGLKDIYATAGIRTTSHSKICENLVPTEDATTVAKLYQAGAVLIGKLARTSSHTVARRLIYRGRRRAIRGTAITSLTDHRAAPGLRLLPVLSLVRSAPILAARSAAPPRCAASLA